jgi:hypothetical protein
MDTTKSQATKQKQQSGQCYTKGGITDKGDAGTGGSGNRNFMKVQVRQNRKGNWWCNTTFHGTDISVEKETMEGAKQSIRDRLFGFGYRGDIVFDEPVYYDRFKPKRNVSWPYSYRGIDHNPQG